VDLAIFLAKPFPFHSGKIKKDPEKFNRIYREKVSVFLLEILA